MFTAGGCGLLLILKVNGLQAPTSTIWSLDCVGTCTVPAPQHPIQSAPNQYPSAPFTSVANPSTSAISPSGAGPSTTTHSSILRSTSFSSSSSSSSSVPCFTPCGCDLPSSPSLLPLPPMTHTIPLLPILIIPPSVLPLPSITNYPLLLLLPILPTLHPTPPTIPLPLLQIF